MSSVLDRCLSPVTLLSIVYFVLLCSIASSSSISWLMTAQSSFLFFCLRNSSKFHVQLSHLMFNRPFCGKWTLVATKDCYKANLGRVRDSAISTKKWEGGGRGGLKNEPYIAKYYVVPHPPPWPQWQVMLWSPSLSARNYDQNPCLWF